MTSASDGSVGMVSVMRGHEHTTRQPQRTHSGVSRAPSSPAATTRAATTFNAAARAAGRAGPDAGAAADRSRAHRHPGAHGARLPRRVDHAAGHFASFSGAQAVPARAKDESWRRPGHG